VGKKMRITHQHISQGIHLFQLPLFSFSLAAWMNSCILMSDAFFSTWSLLCEFSRCSTKQFFLRLPAAEAEKHSKDRYRTELGELLKDYAGIMVHGKRESRESLRKSCALWEIL
jgi:hypothetical protein